MADDGGLLIGPGFEACPTVAEDAAAGAGSAQSSGMVTNCGLVADGDPLVKEGGGDLWKIKRKC